MDILDRFLIRVEQLLGPEVFKPEMAEAIEMQFRHDYGADSHYIASLRAFECEKRHKEVRRLIRNGMQNTDIAERTGLTRQQVWNIRQGMTVKQSG